MKYQLLLCFSLLLISSCIQEVDFDIPTGIVQVGINCILVSNEAPELSVYQTCSMQESLNMKFITDAEVRLVRSDGIQYQFKLSDDSTLYLSDAPAIQGLMYSLEVIVKDQIYTANTTIPGTIGALQAEYDHGNYVDEYGEDLTHMTIAFEDIPGEDNFFQMFLMDSYSSDPPSIINFWNFDHISDPILVEESLLEYEPTGFIFSDKKSSNGLLAIELFGFFGLDNGKPPETDIVVRSVSEELFEFLNSWIIHSYNQNNPNHVNVLDDLDPYRIFFQEQPVPLYSNISGGVGIFAGYSESRTSFTYVER
jgi:hypothetical protein